MTIINLDELAPQALVAQLVVELRGGAAVLPYADYEVIDDWLESSPSIDMLLMVLAEELPAWFAKKPDRPSQSIRGVRRRVLKILKEHQLRTAGVQTS
jgi:hypothetical protein